MGDEQGGETLFDRMTDLEKARALVKKCRGGHISNEITESLSTLVQKNQNRDTADGSISEEQWYALRDTMNAMVSFVSNSEKFMNESGGW